ncbi:uncharacterized protein LOC128852392 [Cuculus canorus]|uniref:uncharacterized protein LOC128852392 n=1 Tax=Cuculus canorus TaxID=55661 RepID=UPI0023AB230D|nr:uncharacterized protein LOC128852392 [Cuculus canorus]
MPRRPYELVSVIWCRNPGYSVAKGQDVARLHEPRLILMTAKDLLLVFLLLTTANLWTATNGKFYLKTKLRHSGFRKGASDMPKTRMGKLRRRMQRLSLSRDWETGIRLLAMLLSTLWLLQHGCKAETYWAFVPNPPIIHPVTWEEPTDIPVHNNQTMFMGQYSDKHIVIFSARFNFSGRLDGNPMCFQINRTESSCEEVIIQHDWDTNVSCRTSYYLCNPSRI